MKFENFPTKYPWMETHFAFATEFLQEVTTLITPPPNSYGPSLFFRLPGTIISLTYLRFETSSVLLPLPISFRSAIMRVIASSFKEIGDEGLKILGNSWSSERWALQNGVYYS